MEGRLALVLLICTTVFIHTECQQGMHIATIAEWVEIFVKCQEAERMNVGLRTDCNLHARCPAHRMERPVVKPCPVGTQYDDTTQRCEWADLVDCASQGSVDPCVGVENAFIEDEMRNTPTRGYWCKCVGGRTSRGGRCEICQAFDVSTPADNMRAQCVNIPGCTAQTTPYPNNCFYEPDPDNPRMYFSIGATRTHMPCANGTAFSVSDCVCVFA